MTTPMLHTIAENVLVPADDEVTSGFSVAPTYNRPSGIVGIDISVSWQGQNPTPGDITVSMALALTPNSIIQPLPDVTVPANETGKLVAINAQHANYLIVTKIANASTASDAKVTIRATA